MVTKERATEVTKDASLNTIESIKRAFIRIKDAGIDNVCIDEVIQLMDEIKIETVKEFKNI